MNGRLMKKHFWSFTRCARWQVAPKKQRKKLLTARGSCIWVRNANISKSGAADERRKRGGRWDGIDAAYVPNEYNKLIKANFNYYYIFGALIQLWSRPHRGPGESLFETLWINTIKWRNGMPLSSTTIRLKTSRHLDEACYNSIRKIHFIRNAI